MGATVIAADVGFGGGDFPGTTSFSSVTGVGVPWPTGSAARDGSRTD